MASEENPIAMSVKPFSCDPHLVHGDLRSWITEPPGMINEVAAGCMVTAQIATDMTTKVDAAMRARWPGQKYIYIHDFSRAWGYEVETVKILVKWGRASMRDVAAIVVVVSPRTREIDKASVQFGQMALDLFGVPMEISEDLDEIVKRFGLRPAA